MLIAADASQDFHLMEGSGFREDLIRKQGSDVYKHINGMAGGTLVGDHYVAFGK